MRFWKKISCITCVLTIGLLLGPNNVHAQTVTAASVPSEANPESGDQITVAINIDVSGTNELLGSFTGSLNWDENVLSYVSHSGVLAGFVGSVNDGNATNGELTFNGANPNGAAGNSNVLNITFNVAGSQGSSTILDLEFSAMSAALTFTNLLPFLAITDGSVNVDGGGNDLVIAESAPSNANPLQGATITVDIDIDVSQTDPAELLGSFTGSLNWDQSVLEYDSNGGLESGFVGSVNDNNVSNGELNYNGANPNGASGSTTVLTITFTVIGNPGTSTVLDLGFSAMAAALSFRDLLPALQINDGVVTVQGDGDGPDARVECPPAAEGGTVTIPVYIDMSSVSPPDQNLGSFTGSLDWDSNVLAYNSNSGLQNGFVGSINENNVNIGRLDFNGANPNGATGDVLVLEVTFDVIGVDGDVTTVDLDFTAMAAALTFADLLPDLTISDCTVEVEDDECEPGECPTSGPIVFAAPENAEPGIPIKGVPDDTIYVEIRMRNNTNDVRAFGLNFEFEPAHLDFVTSFPGDLTANWIDVGANENMPGQLTVGGFNTTGIPPNSTGALIRLCFVVVCEPPAESQIMITELVNDIASFAACNNCFVCIDCEENGDVDGDGALTPGDALCAFEIFLNNQMLPPQCDFPNADCELIAADPDCDGLVTPGDALGIFDGFLAGLPPQRCFAQSGLAKGKTDPFELSFRQEIKTGVVSEQQQILSMIFTADRPENLSAFGFKLDFPAEKLQFLSIERTALTRDWTRLDARESAMGELLIGGFHPNPMTAKSPGDLFQVRFKIKDENLKASEFYMSELMNDFSHAAVNQSGPAEIAKVPESFKLHQNFPNPFSLKVQNNGTAIRYDVPGTKPVSVDLSIYNVNGQLVRRLVSGQRQPGAFEVEWDGKDSQGMNVPSGTYFYKLTAGENAASRRLTIIR